MFLNIFSLIYRLFHEEFRTNEILEPVVMGDDLVFEFRGFKGTYNISVILEDGTNHLVDDQFTISD